MATAEPVYDPALTGGGAPASRKVTLGAANQVFSIPVLTPESIVRIDFAHLINNTAGNLTVTVKINGSATNASIQDVSGVGAAVSATAGRCGFCRASQTMGVIGAFKAAKLAGERRLGSFNFTGNDGGVNTDVLIGSIVFKDTTTVITTIDFDSGVATGWTAGSYAWVTEIPIS